MRKLSLRMPFHIRAPRKRSLSAGSESHADSTIRRNTSRKKVVEHKHKYTSVQKEPGHCSRARDDRSGKAGIDREVKVRAGNHHCHRHTKERNERAATHTWAPRYVQRRDTRVRFNHEILKSYGSSTPLAAGRLVCVFAETSSHTATVLWAFFLWKGKETLHFVILLGVNGLKKTWVPKCHFQHNSRAGKGRTATPRHLKLCGKTQFGSIKTSDEHFALARGRSFCLESHTRCVHFFEQSSFFPLRIRS